MEEFYTLRSLETHLQHCALIEDDTTGELSKEYGVNCRSTLLDLENFDMCSGTLLPDVMHDLLEGVLQHVIKLLLSYCIEEKKYFTLATLNEKILGIELGYMEDNRPAPLDHWKHIRQNGMVHVMHILAYVQLFLLITASQTWTLSRFLPLMVGCCVPEDDIYWHHYATLLQITGYVLAPEIFPDDVAWLNVIIVDFLSEFAELYPDASVIPKMHYMVHVPRLMMK